MSNRQDTQLQKWLDQLRAGNPSACDELVNHACERLRRLTRKMLHGYPKVHRWEQTDDVLQKSLLRLRKALSKVKPKTVKGLFGLASKLIRQELIDLGRHHLGPHGIGGRHDSKVDVTNEQDNASTSAPFSPQILKMHKLVEEMSKEDRDIIDFLFYQDMTKAKTALALGIPEQTLTRRWREIRLDLRTKMKQ